MELFEDGPISIYTKLAAPGLVVCTFHGPLCYANAESVMCAVLSLINSAPSAPQWLVVDFDLIPEIDYCGAKMVAELYDRMAKQGVTFVFANPSTKVVDFLSDLGLLSTFRLQNVFGSVDAALEAYEALKEGAHSTPNPD
jgi:MFS superfamily sulfate permease-like transporter